MSVVFALVCKVSFLFCAPLLLVARLVWPKRFPWWAVILCAVCLGWALLVLNEHMNMLEVRACPEIQVGSEVAQECPYPMIVDRSVYFLELGWSWAFIYLVPWLGIYGIVQLVRRHQANSKHA
jgi:hypothetical protein